MNALATGADEGRDEQRYASGSGKYAEILVPVGKESNNDSLSSGERTGTSPVLTLELQNL